MTTSKPKTALVVGATGNTGKHVVQFLLDQGHTVRVVARSAEKMKGLLKPEESYGEDRLQITQASLLELSDTELQDLVKDCDAVISCLGHNMSFQGMFGRKTRRLVTDSVTRLQTAMEATNTQSPARLIVMGSDGVAHPSDNRRGVVERFVLFLLRHLVPPHADNEAVAAYLLSLPQTSTSVEWCVVRPTDLQEGPPTPYKLYDKPPGSLFGSGIATRATVATFMTELATHPDLFQTHKFQMPVIHDQDTESKKSK